VVLIKQNPNLFLYAFIFKSLKKRILALLKSVESLFTALIESAIALFNPLICCMPKDLNKPKGFRIEKAVCFVKSLKLLTKQAV
jgi:hypothetical protein